MFIVFVFVILVISALFYTCATGCFKDEKQELKTKLEQEGIEFQRLKSRDILNEQEMKALKRALD